MVEKVEVYNLENKLTQKWLAGEIDFTSFAELMYDVISVRVDVQFPTPGGLPREDRNPIRLHRKLLLEARSNLNRRV